MKTSAIAERLVKSGMSLFRKKRRPIPFTGNEAADALLNDIERYPHAFVLACVMDRQVTAETAWRVPALIRDRCETFEIADLAALSARAVRRHFARPTPLHRFKEKMAVNFYEAVQLISTEYKGNAALIWSDKPSSAEVVLRFLRFRGVGPKIATMATNLLVRNFKVPLADYYSVDISADRQVRRVFQRLGLISKDASNEEIVYTARSLSPRFPGLLDSPAWQIGRDFCKAKVPLCSACFMKPLCPTAASVTPNTFR